MYCTTLQRKKRIMYRCVSLLLLASLLIYPFSPILTHEVWHEELVLWPIRRGPHRRYRRAIECRFPSLRQWGLILLCRLGLMAALLLWSGWPQRQAFGWALLALPVIDSFLFLLPRYRPGVLKRQAYLPLARGVHDSYRLALVILLGLGLSLHAIGPFRMAGSMSGLAMIGGCVKKAEGAWARGAILEDGTWCLEMEGHFLLPRKPRNVFEERILLVLWRQMRTPQSPPQRSFLRQEWLAESFGTHQELISRWQRTVREGGLQKLNGECEGRVRTPELSQAILDIWVPNFWLSAAEVRERLVSRGQIGRVEEISLQSIYREAEGSGFGEVRRQLRRTLSFTAKGAQWKDKVLVQRLFELNETLIARLQAGQSLT
ncbi:hypothetical protein ACFLYD_07390, partial [Chloroflexota bacterium]